MKHKILVAFINAVLCCGSVFTPTTVHAQRSTEAEKEIITAYPQPTRKKPIAPLKTKQEIIAEAALAQLGVIQDCTMLATNSLAAAGIYFHG